MNAAAKNIKTIRELKNFTQEYMAVQLCMSVSNYSNIENGKTNVTINRLEEIAQVLNVDLQQILSHIPLQIFNNNNGLDNGNSVTQTNYVNEEAIKLLQDQLKTKDDQIQKLSAMLEKALTNKKC